MSQLLIVERATKGLTSAAATLTKTLTDLQSGVDALVTQQEELATNIYFKQEELKQVSDSVDVAVREANAEITLRIKEDKQTVLNELLSGANLVSVSPTELQQIRDEAKQIQADMDRVVREAVQSTTAKLTAQHKQELLELSTEQQVAIAQYTANAERDAMTIQMLKDQLAKAEAAVDAEREARITIAEADARKQAVTINQGK